MSHVPMTLPELMISQQAHPFSHTSSYVRLDDGRIFHGSYGASTTSSDNGMTWADTRLMRDTNGKQLYSQTIVRLAGKNAIGSIGEQRLRQELCWKPTWPTPYAQMKRSCQVLFWRSDDGGETWQLPVPVTPHGVHFQTLVDTAIRTSSGRIVVPVYSHLGQKTTGPQDQPLLMSGKLVRNQWLGTAGHFFDPGFCTVVVCYSDDEGQTWQRNDDGDLFILPEYSVYHSLYEPTVTEVKPGRLLMMMRTGLGRLFQAWSNDNGTTWTRAQPTSLAASHAPAQLRTLPNGHLLCVWTQETEEEVKAGYVRTRLSSAISRDGGRVWEFFQNVESIHETTRVEPGPIHPTKPVEVYTPAGRAALERDAAYIFDHPEYPRFSYPSVFIDGDQVLIAYTYTNPVDHPTEAKMVNHFADGKEGTVNYQRLKILPLKWFYGGKQPADNPFLKEAYLPAKP